MREIIQSLSTGKTKVEDIPAPSISDQEVLIKTKASIISAGTEKMLVEFGKANFISKIKKQPDKVIDVLEKIKNDGLINTLESVKSKLDQPISLGYSNVGIIQKVGKNVSEFNVGDRVVSNAPHAELVCASKNLVALIPDNVDDESACFTVIASIGLQGIRLADPKFGESVVVIGLGLIGILTAQMLKANGCNVIGIDPIKSKRDLAESLGIKTYFSEEKKDIVNWVNTHTNQIGADAVLITASTSSNQPIHTAAEISRKRGRIILVGVTGINIRRDLFYKKELTFQVSCSYGPGRYDNSYEKDGKDYPIGFVRWTEKRNFEAVLEALSKKSVITEKLITNKFKIEDADEAYEKLINESESLGIVINYPEHSENQLKKTIYLNNDKRVNKKVNGSCNLSFIGAGNYATRMLIPNFKRNGAYLNTISAKNGINPFFYGKKFGFKKATTDNDEIFNDRECSTIVISTRHDTHADLIVKGLSAGKNIFVEKPLCINYSDLEKIKNAYHKSNFKSKDKTFSPILMIGYNRRFSPLVEKVKNELTLIGQPKSFIYTCNAGEIGKNHWLNDPLIGGGRLIGEACHFIDLLTFLSGSKISDINCNYLPDKNPCPESFCLNIKFENGSIGTINYFSNGCKGYPKENLDIFCSGKIFKIENYRKLSIYSGNKKQTIKLWKQDKGQNKCVSEFLKAIKEGKESPINTEEIFEIQKFIFEMI